MTTPASADGRALALKPFNLRRIAGETASAGGPEQPGAVPEPLFSTQDGREARATLSENQPHFDTQEGFANRDLGQAMPGGAAGGRGGEEGGGGGGSVMAGHMREPADGMDFGEYEFQADHASPEDRRRQQTFIPRLDGLDERSYVAQVWLVCTCTYIYVSMYMYIYIIRKCMCICMFMKVCVCMLCLSLSLCICFVCMAALFHVSCTGSCCPCTR
jgi:hypothetical protein